MSFEVKIPAVGESISSGVIAQWHKQNGESVASGDLLLTLETDKISTEITAETDGVLEILAAEGEEVNIGAIVAKIAEGEGSAPAPEAEAEAEAPKAETASISAAAKKLADKKGIDIATIKGTGKDGNITKKDVENASAPVEAPKPAPTEAPAPVAVIEEKPKPAAVAVSQEGRFTRKPMSPLRRKIATHLVNAQQSAAILTTFNECDMSAIMGMRKQLQEDFVARYGTKLGFMSFFIKAVVEALKAVPTVNAQIDGNDMILNHFFDIGVAIGTEKGLIVPVIRDCDQKSFAEIEQAIIDYANKAREGKIQYEDLQGGVFTISNGGTYGSMLSTPILSPPQSGILGMHNIMQRPVVIDGQIVARPMMYLALSYDHRIVDGKEAVTFLVRIKDCIENPTRLLVGA
jgi:2-oxoglutarate dehydrogenase E2 component (dihydrolipoamide succinyltransferase)